jgi:amidase
MHTKVPTGENIKKLADQYGLGVTAEQASEYAHLISDLLPAYKLVGEIAAEQKPLASTTSRDFYYPHSSENIDNAWHIKTSITTHQSGRLAGKRIALKDSVMLAGVPFLNGSNIYEGFTPDVDATVVTRILEAGGEIAGKTHCEYLCLSGSSHTNWTGPTDNAWKVGYSAGGSSSGSATVVARGEVDMAIGADQAGSIRMPSSFSGIYGLKPTYGLVPYTGIAPLEATIDHVGPMTATVMDNALLLEVIAGMDGIDSRQRTTARTDYIDGIDTGIKGLRIGVVTEGFGTAQSEQDVDAYVRAAIGALERLGAIAEEVSIPLHSDGLAIWSPVGNDGITATALIGNGFGLSRLDYYPTSFMEWTRDHSTKLDQAPPNVKLYFLTSLFARQEYGFVPYGQGINAAQVLRRKYDEALEKYDLLVMPTTPHKAVLMLISTRRLPNRSCRQGACLATPLHSM